MTAQRPITHLLYLHGFRSSPKSNKARRMASLLATLHPELVWWCPQLSASPRQAMLEVMQTVADWPHDRMAVIGSSLGGFYATWVAEQTRCKAVLLNPAVDPARDLAQHIGEHSLWHDPAEHFFFREEFVQELRNLTLPHLSFPERSLAMIAKGDELLDWREMLAHYARAQVRLIDGSDHALSDFEAHLPALLEFLGLD
ncbi:MAG: YqiA/YcfP family alpha/beta fold hydrolase [Comamonadaceae bacterium]